MLVETVSSSDRTGRNSRFERALVPHQEAIDGRLARERAELGVHDAAVLKVDRAALLARREVHYTGLAADVDGLQEVDEPHVGEGATEARLGRDVAQLQALALLALQLEVHAGDDLFDVDRLGEVVLDAELQAPDLALDRAVARQEHEGDAAPVVVLPELLHQLEAVHAGQARVGEDQVGRRKLDHLDRLFGVATGSDRVASLTKAHLEDPQATRVGIDEQQVLFRHGVESEWAVWERGCAGVKRLHPFAADRGPTALDGRGPTNLGPRGASRVA